MRVFNMCYKKIFMKVLSWIMRLNKKQREENGMYCKNLRLKNGFTVEEVAEDLGISEWKLRRFEAGKYVFHSKLLATALLMYFERAVAIVNNSATDNENK